MAHLIDKDALVAEIKRISCENPMDNSWYVDTEELLDFLDTLEVKGVDLNEEIANQYEANYEEYLTYEEFADIAKHFFELALSLKNS